MICCGDYQIGKSKQWCIYDFRGDYITRRKRLIDAIAFVRELIAFHNNPDNIDGTLRLKS